jgi:hypothetical protein
MTFEEFRQALIDALNRHSPRSEATITESRGVALTCRVELDADTFVYPLMANPCTPSTK